MFATILIVTLSPVSWQSDDTQKAFRAVDTVDWNFVDEGAVVVAYRSAVRNQIFEHIGIDYMVLPVRLAQPNLDAWSHRNNRA
jgi:hypothetical protein